MTYCVAMLLEEGLVALADSRTNAGVDHIAVFPKLHLWETPGERTMVLLTAGNLSISQSVVALLTEGVGDPDRRLDTVSTMFEAAQLVGDAVRAVHARDAAALKEHGADFNVSLILGGQIKGRRLRLFMIYAAGNFIEASRETPYFQIGEAKYGKPIIDRVVKPDMPLIKVAKSALISMDSTLKSNVSVGLPLDILIYRRDALRVAFRRRIDENDAYFSGLRQQWSEGLRSVFNSVPDPDWTL
jgi:putative proteasome-type protease